MKDFDWQTFLTRVREENVGIVGMVAKFNFTVENGVLHLYAPNKSVLDIVSKKENIRLLRKAAGGAAVLVEDLSMMKKDETISRISAIMGKVQEVNSGGEIFQ